LDRRVGELRPQERDRYLAVLRRYHDSHNALPEDRQDELDAQSAGERMALVGKLARAHPVPNLMTPQVLRVAEVGELSPFELASIYRIWHALPEAQRALVDRAPMGRGRREMLFRKGSSLKTPVPRETKPPDYDEEKWIGQVETYWRTTQPALLVEEPAKTKLDEPAKTKQEIHRREVVRRQAINLYLVRTEVHPVDPERLARFVSALPTWAQTALDSDAPDEARRRLTFAYRLVFPHPDEIGSSKRAASSPTKKRAGPASKTAAPTLAKPKAAPPPTPDSPF
jgi:hypothetical protein